MGCTSSSPSFVDSSSSSIRHRNATVTEDIELEQQMTAIEESNETIVNNNLKDQKNSEKTAPVLPESDNVVETLGIGRNVKIDIDVVPERRGPDESTDVIKKLSEKKIDENTIIEVLLTEKKEAEERRQKEMEFLEEFAKLTQNEVSEVVKENETAATEDLLVDKNADSVADEKEDVISVNSRTTRWEALADVAAELPPSLAVDPLTGQIYALK